LFVVVFAMVIGLNEVPPPVGRGTSASC
jgi:hypothetical protein